MTIRSEIEEIIEFHECHHGELPHAVYSGEWKNLAKALEQWHLENKPVVDVDKVGDILTKAFGCKPSREDCSFKDCIKWGQCEVLSESIANADIYKE